MNEPDMTVQHQAPPIYYCWKYWLTNGEVAEGCTSVNTLASADDVLPDLNLYGWIYIALPVFILAVLVFIFYKLCRGTHKPSPELLDDSSLIEDEYGNVGDSNDLYTVVSVDGHPAKVPVQPKRFANTVSRLYPRLSAVNSFRRPPMQNQYTSARRNYNWPSIVRSAAAANNKPTAPVVDAKDEKVDLVVKENEEQKE